MKELVKFSLKRRFWNSAAVLLNVLLCLVVCGVLFADKLIELVNPSLLDVQRIYLNVDEKIKVVKYLQEKGTFKVKGAIVLVAEKLAVSEPTVYRYLKKMEK